MPTFTKRGTGKRWRGQVKYAGRIVKTKWFGSTRAEYKKAVVWEDQVRKQIKALEAEGRLNLKTHMVSINEWAYEYLSYAQENLALKTYAEKRKAFRELFKCDAIRPDKPVKTITTQAVFYHLTQQKRQRSANAANKDRKNLCAAWAWGARTLGFPKDSVTHNPFLYVKRFPEKHHPRYVPTEDDFWKVYEHASGQDKVMLLALLHLGARRGEVFRLRWDQDVNLDAKKIRVMTIKTVDGSEKYDWLPMTDELANALEDWEEARPLKDEEHIFVSLADNQHYGKPFKHRNKFMPVVCAQAGVQQFGYHAIRHLSASILFREGQPLRVIQKLLRHSTPRTTERYLHSLGLDKDLEKAVSVFEGRRKGKGASCPDGDQAT